MQSLPITTKTDHHDITQILLKVVLKTVMVFSIPVSTISQLDFVSVPTVWYSLFIY
jgi:hypothetical protein